MTRTNIDLDDEALSRVMERYGLSTKREAVNFALREAAGRWLSTDELLALRGVGWDGELEEIKDNPVEEWGWDASAAEADSAVR